MRTNIIKPGFVFQTFALTTYLTLNVRDYNEKIKHLQVPFLHILKEIETLLHLENPTQPLLALQIKYGLSGLIDGYL